MCKPLLRIVTILSLFAANVLGQESPPVRITAELEPRSSVEVDLVVRAKIEPGLHIYAQTQPKPFLATQLNVQPQPAIESVGEFVASKKPLVMRHKSLDVELHEHEHDVEWRSRLRLNGELAQPTLLIEGTVFAQACEADRCYAPRTYPFVAETHLPAAMATPMLANKDATAAATRPEFSLDTLAVRSTNHKTAWSVLPLAFVAGFLLNFMPCVLPVVGLKLLSFVQQANSDRRRILLMNLSYTSGLLSVMLILATLATFAGLGWGEQFSSAAFTVTLSTIVFAFGLSFLGVWEIPLPGFVGDASGRVAREGYGGAFSKGILSTLLATPCSGPFLGAALAWAVAQPPYLTYAVFGAVGLGMASPYLVVGLFPSTIAFLPKPGNWMVTFKQVMGFIMLGTVVYLMSFMPISHVVPTVLLLLGVGLALWYVGRTPLHAASREYTKAWSGAIVIVAIVAVTSFGWLQQVMQTRFERAAERLLADKVTLTTSDMSENDDAKIDWEPYSATRLEDLVRRGTPVFIDFTADWCLTCKSNEVAAIETPAFAQALTTGKFVALRADKTEPNPEADALLRKLGNSAASIPFYAFFPADNPNEPILLDGLHTSAEPFVKAAKQSAGSYQLELARLRDSSNSEI